MMDITPRIQRERERDRLLHRYREARLSSEILREVTLALTSSLDQSAILDTILSQAARLVPFDSGNIRLLEDGRLRTTRWFGYEERGAEEFIAAFNEHVDNLNMAREVIENATPRIINDTAEEPNFVIFPETSYIRSLILMPISTARKFYGLLSVESSSPDMYGPEDTRKLKPLADATAVALENAALYEELRSELEERKRVEQRLELSLSQKETLLREIHHRVKNNLSMVISLINLQSSQIADETARELLEHIGNKIHSIILIHEKLYRSHDLQHIALREYVQELLSILRDTIVEEGTVQVDNDIAEDLAVDIERAIPLALIITELFTNSYKYGNRGGCRFSVRVRREGDTAELRAQDNGPGFPPGFSLDQGDTLGLLLVQSLASQLGGTARIGDPEKAEILVRFPLTSDDERSASPSPHTPSQRP
jgi:two-component sensor histidine kinase